MCLRSPSDQFQVSMRSSFTLMFRLIEILKYVVDIEILNNDFQQKRTFIQLNERLPS